MAMWWVIWPRNWLVLRTGAFVAATFSVVVVRVDPNNARPIVIA